MGVVKPLCAYIFKCHCYSRGKSSIYIRVVYAWYTHSYSMAELTITATQLSFDLIQDRRLIDVVTTEPPRYINGVRLPKEEVRESRLRNSGNIAAIDFGTSSCSLAYWMKGDKTIRLLTLGSDDVRVPTAILMDSNGKVVEFGKSARRKFAQLTKEKKQHHYFFNDIKMILQHDKVFNIM